MERYFRELAEAFVKGRVDPGPLRLHKFKNNAELPRVSRILGVLHALQPTNLMDLGSGRGTFLWPLLNAFPTMPVTAVDIHPVRLRDLAAVRRGGVERLSVLCANLQMLPVRENAFDVVTMLEVLEHLPDPQAAARCALGAARRFLLVTVPSKPDSNPEHIHAFSADDLRRIFESAGASRIQFDGVPNHRVVVVRR